MVKLRHGFKAEAERLACELRDEIGILHDAPLCPRLLAKHLEIPVQKISELQLDEVTIDRLCNSGNDQFFGCVIPLGVSKKGIIHNDFVGEMRQNSDIAHEIAHILLGHPLTQPYLGDGERSYDAVLEHEARELGMTLLITKKAALKIAMGHVSDRIAADKYGVSPKLLAYRIRMTNAKNWAYNKKTRAHWG